MRRLLLVTAMGVGLALGWPAGLDKPFGEAPAVAAATISTVVENIVVPLGGATLTIKRMEVAAGGSSGGDILALFDRSNPKPLVEQLRALASPSIVMPEIVVELRLHGGSGRAVLRDVRLVDIAKGRIGAVSVGGARLSIGDARPAVRHGDAGAMSARNIDLVQFARVMAEPRAPAGEAPAALFEYVAIDNVDAMLARDVHVAVARFSASRLMARTLTVPLADLFRRLGAIENGPQPRREKERAQILMAEDVAASLGIGAIEIRDITLNNPVGNEEMRFARMALRDLADFRLGELTVEGFTMPEPRRPLRAPAPAPADAARPVDGPASDAAGSASFQGSTFTLASLRGLDFRPAVGAFNAILNAESLSGPESVVRAVLPVFDRAVLLGLFVDLPDPRSTPGGRMQLRLDRLEAGGEYFIRGLPGALLIVLQRLDVDAAFFEAFGVASDMRTFGLSKLKVATARLDLGWNEATREIALKSLAGEVAGIGTMAVTATIGNAAPDLFSSNPLVEQAAGLATVFKGLELRFTDAGLTDKLVAVVAQQRNASLSDTRVALVRDAAVTLPAELGGGRAAKALGNALAKFVAHPQNLRITATSLEGLGFPDVVSSNGPADVLERLEVTPLANE